MKKPHLANICYAVVLIATAGNVSAAVEIEEIVVTAQKREQSLNDVGIAVTAFNDQSIRELGLSQPIDLAAQTPNLNINDTLSNSIPNISIRGIGLNDYAVNNNPAAGIYVDEIYLVSPAMLSFQLFDLERVEVLKGPQGTLYGRNTTAGIVNFVSRKPTDVFEANISVGAGNFDRFTLEGAISGQITSGLNGRIALQTTRQGEGHQFNRATGKDVGEVDRTSLRGIIDWQLSENTNAVLSLHSGSDKSDTWLLKVDNALTPDDDAFFPGDPFSAAGRPDTFLDIENNGASLVINGDLSESLNLVSVTGYEDYSRRHVEDRDGTALAYLDGEFLNDIEQISQEFRLTYSNSSLTVIVGMFVENDEVATRDHFDAPELLEPLGLGRSAIGNEYTQETNSAALFLHTEWQFADDWKLTTGLRYTDEEKEYRDVFTFLIPDGGTESQLFTPVTNNYDVSDVSGKIGLDYTGADNALWYASISKGFKSGNFQGQLAFTPDPLAPFDEENLIAYEIGFKSRFLDNSLQFNGSVFFYDYQDIQIYGPIFDSPVGPLFGIDNAGDAEVTGAEFDLVWRLTGGLDIGLGLGLLDTEITDSVLPGVAQGSELPNSPEINFNANIKYSRNIGDNLLAEAILDTSYKDDVNYDIVRAPVEAVEDGYWLTNLRLGVSAPKTENGGGWGVHFWTKNLSDERYRTQVLTSSVGFGETWGLPRTYGLTLDLHW